MNTVPILTYQKVTTLKSKPMSDGRCMFAIDGRSGFAMLNPSAWFVLELCESKRFEDIVAEYEAATKLQDQRSLVRVCLDELEKIGVVHAV